MAGQFRQLFRVTLDASHSLTVRASAPSEAIRKACTYPDCRESGIIKVEKYGEIWEPELEAKSE